MLEAADNSVFEVHTQRLRPSFVAEMLSAHWGQGKEGNMIKGFNFAAGLIIVIVLHGCAGQGFEIKRNDVFYRDRSEKLPLKIGLFLNE